LPTKIGAESCVEPFVGEVPDARLHQKTVKE